MLKIIGSVPFKNNKERRLIFRKIKNEFGQECQIWVEDNVLFYKYKINSETAYF
jgi:hypothetical protein